MGRAIRMLLVEDDPLDAELVLRELRRAGFEPTWERVDTEDGFLAKLNPDLAIILSDYQMPSFNGLRALELLKESGLDIPFILISGTIGEDLAVDAMKRGAVDYLLKDRLARLGQAVTHALDQSHIRRERRLAREKLALRERALGAVSQGVLICDEHRRVIYANSSFTKITGYELGEVLGKSCAILQGPGTSQETIQRIRVALEANLPFEGEILNYRKDGSIFWNELSLTPIRDNRGGPVMFIGTQRDVTERKLAGEALRQSEESLRRERAQLRALIDSIPDLIFFKNKDSEFLGCNLAFERYLGVKEGDVIGKTDFDLEPKMADFYRTRDREMLETGKPQVTEEWILDRRGGSGLFETVKTPYFGPEGQSLGLVAVSRNITERKKAEEEMRAVLDRLKIAAEAAQSGIWELDTVEDTANWDAQMFKIYGVDPANCADGVDRWFQRMEAEDISRCEQILQEAVELNRNSFDMEFPIHRASDGEKRLIRSMGIVRRNEKGEMVCMVGMNRDVTVERQREKDLANALAQEKEMARRARAGDQAKGDFLAAMSHELRTPMNGILGFAELLEQAPQLPDDCRQYAQTIMQSGEALLRILDDILDFSRMEAGRLVIESVQFDPRRMMRDVHNLFERQAREKDLELIASVDEKTPAVLTGDAGRIRQVLVNLVGNAVKFTESGHVKLTLAATDEDMDGKRQFQFCVSDTGPGISPAKIEFIFQPFTQADSSISRKHGGTGLGLTISRRLAELLGGSLTATSSLGEGSAFCAVIPLAVADENAKAASEVTEQSLDINFATENPLSILVVEDDKINLKLIQALIRRLGYQPLAAQNGREAVDVYRAEKPNCILMDLQMPEMDGIEATRSIRAIEQTSHGCQAFISALTANTVPADRQRCFDSGMNEYLNKPVRMSSLAKILKSAHDYREAVS